MAGPRCPAAHLHRRRLKVRVLSPVPNAEGVSVGRTGVRSAGGSSMRGVGIDPGLPRCGWGVVDGRPGARPTAIDVGVIRTMAELDLELRLLELHTAVTALASLPRDLRRSGQR